MTAATFSSNGCASESLQKQIPERRRGNEKAGPVRPAFDKLDSVVDGYIGRRVPLVSPISGSFQPVGRQNVNDGAKIELKRGEVVTDRTAMKRHRLLGALIVSLTATLALWPIAVEFGGGPRGQAPAAIDRALFGPEFFAETTETVWDCAQFGAFPGLRGNGRERACGPGKGLHARSGRAAQEYGPVGGGPLDEAVLASIAGGEAGPASLFEVPGPDDALHSQTMAAARGKGFGDPWSGPIAGGNGLPGNLLAGDGPSFDEPPLDPETPVVPIPGALPLMLTGLAAFAAMKRARGRAAGFSPRPLQG